MSESAARTSADEILPPTIGNLSKQSPQGILSALERHAFCGELRFTMGEKNQVVPFLAGQPQLNDESQKSIERFMTATTGTYELREQIPVPPKGSRSTPLRVYGTLAELSPSELLRFCESIGLSGKLEMRAKDDLCVARYAKGELETLAIDGKDDTAIDVVFGWDDGKWSITQKSIFDDEPPSAVIDVRNELGTIELALSELLARGGKSHGDVSAPTTIAGQVHHSPADTSVKIIFRAPKLEQSPPTRHSATNVGKEVVSLDNSNTSSTMSDEQAEQIIAASKAPSVPPPSQPESSTLAETPVEPAPTPEQSGISAVSNTTANVQATNRARMAMVTFVTMLVFSLSTIVIALAGLLR